MADYYKYRGLTSSEIESNRLKYGSNVLTPPKRKSVILQFFLKFADPLIVILLIAGMLSVGISCYEYLWLHHGMEVFFEPIGIFVAIFLATGLGFIFEYKAEKEFEVLNRINDEEPVQVIRDGNMMMIPKCDVVYGDVVCISAGEEIPADGTLLEATKLSIDESTLTGEPICHKTTDATQFDNDATFPSNMVLRGTKVMEGHGIFQVSAVGDATENGKVFEAAQEEETIKTPLNIQLEKVGTMISRMSYIIGGLVIVGRVLMYILSGAPVSFETFEFPSYILKSIMLAVTLVVMAVPEGLPMAVTLSLAYSMRRMLRTNNLVRKMHACETMGAVTVICTDKTGTLTSNRMVVTESKFFDSESAMTIDGIAINSTAELDFSDPEHPKPIGNPTEGALLLYLYEKGYDYREIRARYRIVGEIPFSTELKYMATLAEDTDGHRYLFVKGAPEIVRRLCKAMSDADVEREFQATLRDYQNHAMRTLAFAGYPVTGDVNTLEDNKITAPELRLCGIVGIADPVREDVPEAVAACRNAGIDIKVITGDTPATAKEISRRIGLWTAHDDETAEAIALGEEIAAMTDDELTGRVQRLKIIARARPMDKKRIVEALQRCEEVVAVTGDGTNDAPALHAAHVGLSMGSGTSVAKEASDITIIDNSFASIRNAVMWGRSLYKNIQRFLLFQLTVNLTACVTVMIGSFMGTAAPLTVTQMLWVNLIMDTFAAMALSTLPPSKSVMVDKPRSSDAFIISPTMIQAIVSVGVIFSLTLIGLLYVLEHVNAQSILDIFNRTQQWTYKGLDGYEECLFFTVFVMLQFWNLFNAKAFESDKSIFNMRHCSEFLLIALVILVGQILIVTFGGKLFNVVPLKTIDWVIIFFGTMPVLILRPFRKYAVRKIAKKSQRES